MIKRVGKIWHIGCSSYITVKVFVFKEWKKYSMCMMEDSWIPIIVRNDELFEI